MRRLLGLVTRGYVRGGTSSQAFNEGSFYESKRRSQKVEPSSESRGQPAEIFRLELEACVNGRVRMPVATEIIFRVAV